jgi:hypothetical protein
MHETSGTNKRQLRNDITLQVLLAIVAAIVLGKLDPSLALAMVPLGDLFIKLIRMAIAPVVFLCVSTGVAHIGDIHKAGRIGLKAQELRLAENCRDSFHRNGTRLQERLLSRVWSSMNFRLRFSPAK